MGDALCQITTGCTRGGVHVRDEGWATRAARLTRAICQFTNSPTMEVSSPLGDDFESALQERTNAGCAYDARVAGLLLALLDALRRQVTGPRLYAFFRPDGEVSLHYRAPNDSRCVITVTVDRPDYGPLENGLPRFHYRMTYQITNSWLNRAGPVVEERMRTVDSAVEFLQDAIRETRGLP